MPLIRSLVDLAIWSFSWFASVISVDIQLNTCNGEQNVAPQHNHKQTAQHYSKQKKANAEENIEGLLSIFEGIRFYITQSRLVGC